MSCITWSASRLDCAGEDLRRPPSRARLAGPRISVCRGSAPEVVRVAPVDHACSRRRAARELHRAPRRRGGSMRTTAEEPGASDASGRPASRRVGDVDGDRIAEPLRQSTPRDDPCPSPRAPRGSELGIGSSRPRCRGGEPHAPSGSRCLEGTGTRLPARRTGPGCAGSRRSNQGVADHMQPGRVDRWKSNAGRAGRAAGRGLGGRSRAGSSWRSGSRTTSSSIRPGRRWLPLGRCRPVGSSRRSTPSGGWPIRWWDHE